MGEASCCYWNGYICNVWILGSPFIYWVFIIAQDSISFSKLCIKTSRIFFDLWILAFDFDVISFWIYQSFIHFLIEIKYLCSRLQIIWALNCQHLLFLIDTLELETGLVEVVMGHSVLQFCTGVCVSVWWEELGWATISIGLCVRQGWGWNWLGNSGHWCLCRLMCVMNWDRPWTDCYTRE